MRWKGIKTITIILHLLIILGLLTPAYTDWKSRLVDDRLWLGFIPAYIILLYGLYIGYFPLIDVFIGLLISSSILIFLLISRKIGAVFGGADLILLIIISPLSFIYSPSYTAIPFFHGIIIFLLTMSILGIVYVLTICIHKNFKRFKEIKSIFELFSLLYIYEVEDVDEDKEIIVKKTGKKIYVTPGIPIISFAFLSASILFMLYYLLNIYI